MLGPLHVQGVEVAQERLDERRRVFVERDPGLVRAQDGLVVHVGHVHHLRHLVAEVAQDPPQHVLEQEGAEVADVDVVVDGRAAGVDPRLPGDDRLERGAPAA
jgi:hypothetical protein